MTEARWQTIRGSGATPVATYGTSEAGWIGAQFPGEPQPDGVHVFHDAYAVVPHEAPAAGEGQPRAMLFTGLRAAAPKVLINAGIGDAAVLEGSAPASRPLPDYAVRMHTIRSFRKITVWGATFAIAEIEPLVETMLPAAFGGTLSDYQLVEQQDEAGLPVLTLRVGATVGPIDEAAMKETLMRAIGRLQPSYSFMVEEIRVTNSLRIERCPPQATERGKILPVVARRAA